MRMLMIHADYLKYETKEKTKAAEKIGKEMMKGEFKEPLVIFISFERADEDAIDYVINSGVAEILGVADQIKPKSIVLYPYVHLLFGAKMGSAGAALKILKGMETKLSKKFKVSRTPFGYYKSFELKCKGHPLSEFSRVISPEERDKEGEGVVSKALKEEEKMKSHWYIMQPDGKLVPVEKFNFSKHSNLDKFAKYEIKKSREVKAMPPHVKLMKSLELVGNEPGSDPGNLRYYPKGRLIKSLLEQFVTQRVIDYGGMEVETPIMYDINHPTLSNYLNRFPARQYSIRSGNRDFFLRFSACFGQFLMTHDAQISYRQLPFRIYELTRYSFRREKSGELVGLRRLRAFTMPDVHAMCANLKQAKEEFVKRFDLSRNVLKDGLGLDTDDYELGVRFTKDFYEKNKDFIVSFVKKFGKPVLIEMWDDRFFYFVLKWEFNFVDNIDKASALSTDQIDIENAERYEITYTDKKGEKKHPLILHCSPSGAIERCIYAILEKAYKDEKSGRVPQFPLWLSPTQVRLIPLSDKYTKTCTKLAEKIEAGRIRVDIDDRRDTVEKKIRDAELEWVPFIIVFGEKELKSKQLPVRIRTSGKIEKMGMDKLMNDLKEKTGDMPFKKLSLPKLLSKRPVFSG
jgi:threonyl-tRNA synthetase